MLENGSTVVRILRDWFKVAGGLMRLAVKVVG